MIFILSFRQLAVKSKGLIGDVEGEGVLKFVPQLFFNFLLQAIEGIAYGRGVGQDEEKLTSGTVEHIGAIGIDVFVAQDLFDSDFGEHLEEEGASLQSLFGFVGVDVVQEALNAGDIASYEEEGMFGRNFLKYTEFISLKELFDVNSLCFAFAYPCIQTVCKSRRGLRVVEE